jgi:pyruvate-formate lyase-activating enzyme
MTRIYNITQYTNDDSIYVLFEGCNFQCKGCYIQETKYDYHLPIDVRNRLKKSKGFGQLSLDEFEIIIKRLRVKRAVLGGGEPTLDPELPAVVELLEGLGVKTLLTTNGHALNEKLIGKLEEAGLSGIRMSIRAFDDAIHRSYTGHTNKLVLKNFRTLAKTRIRLIAESILIPGLVEGNEIEKIAEFVASVNPAIPYRIDGFIPFNDAPWKRPSREEVTKAAQLANKHLWIVCCLHCETGHGEREVINIYPSRRDAG